MKIIRLFSVLCLFLVMIGCAAVGEDKLLVDSRLPEQVAILPFYNKTMDHRGALMLREIFHAQLSRSPYSVADLGVVDRVLHGSGIYNRHQLADADPRILGEKLHCDALLYGTLLEFRPGFAGWHLGLAEQSPLVRANFQLISTFTGEILWQTEEVVDKKVQAVKDVPLLQGECEMLAQKAVSKIPSKYRHTTRCGGR